VAFIQANSWSESQRIVEQHPELLTEEADGRLAQLVEVQETDDARRKVEQHRSLLHRCREVGTERAFAERFDVTSNGFPVPEQFRPYYHQAKRAEQRYRRTGDREALDQAVAAWERLLGQKRFSATPNSFQLGALNDSGNVFLRRYWAAGCLSDLNRALRCWEEAVAETPTDSPGLPSRLNNLGIGLSERYAWGGELDDLARAIEAYEQAITQTPTGSYDLPMYLNNLGTGLSARYARTGELDDLVRAIEAHEQAVAQTSTGSSDLPMYLNNLGNRLSERYTRTGKLDDLTQAIGAYEQAITQTPSGSPEQAAILNNLGTGLRARYARTGELSDLERAIETWEQAVAQTPNGSPDLPGYLNNLGNGLSARYARTGKREDLAQAIETWEQAVAQTPSGSPEQATVLNSLGIGLSNRYVQTGKLDDLAQAIEAWEQAVAQTPSGSPNLPSRLNNLGTGLSARYAQTGDLDDLAQAIEAYEQAAAQTPSGSPDLPGYINNLGTGLSDRYARMGELDDLARAIEAYTQAVGQTPSGSPDLPMYLNNLGAVLSDRYVRTGELEDLARAIEAYEQAVAQTPSGSLDLPSRLNNLGTGLRDRYAQTGELDDLARAIEAHEQAVAQTPSGSTDLPSRLNNLGNGLKARYAQKGKLNDLAQAIEAYERAVMQMPTGSPNMSGYLNNLGTGLRDRYARTREVDDLAQAIKAYETACQKGLDTALEESLRAARNWGRWASQREAWAEAGRAYGYGMAAIEHLYRVQLTRRAKATWLREARGLPTRAAYAQAHAGDLTNAVLALEQGRARLLSEILERNHADLSVLQQAHPGHYAAYCRAANRVSTLSERELLPDEIPSDFDLAAEMRAARADLDAAIEAIRDLSGYANFLAAPDWEDVAEAATPERPLVYLAATPAGGLALVVSSSQSSSESDTHPIWLDDLTDEALREQLIGAADDPELGGYLGAYQDWRRNPRDGAARAAWLKAIDETTRWLWDAAMEHVLEALADLDRHRATLIPTGLLGLLPLHAAWTEDPTQPTGRRYALDKIGFTTTPNARALDVARERAAGRDAKGLLAVDEPQPVSASPLPSSSWETAAACDHSPDSETRLLGGEAATKEAVLEAMPDYAVLHLSCHGFANPAEPLESGLLMAHDELLTLRDIYALQLDQARLAVLSACETRLPGTDLPDEVIALPTGLVQAGVPGVVGSLWSVGDLSTAMLMVRFYDLWQSDGLVPAEALRQAQIWLRDTTNGEKAEYFGTELPELNGTRMPEPLADALFKQAALRKPHKRAFAHPFHWAAFAFTGV
jgi:CHAT domain-containing protein